MSHISYIHAKPIFSLLYLQCQFFESTNIQQNKFKLTEFAFALVMHYLCSQILTY